VCECVCVHESACVSVQLCVFACVYLCVCESNHTILLDLVLSIINGHEGNTPP